jgi:cell division protein FtsB
MSKFLKNLFETNQIVRVVGIVIAMSLVWQTVKVVQRNYSLQQQVDRLHDEVAILELQNQRLKFDIEYFKTDSYLELAARQEFDKRAAGERVLALSQDDAVDLPLPEDRATGPPKSEYQQNLEQWLYFLFKIEPS